MMPSTKIDQLYNMATRFRAQGAVQLKGQKNSSISYRTVIKSYMASGMGLSAISLNQLAFYLLACKQKHMKAINIVC